MDLLSFENPVFAAFSLAAALMILKTVLMAWATVLAMMRVGGGYAAPEDARPSPLNPHPRPGQTDPDDRVERWRRIHRNDLENVPFFLVAAFLFVLTAPALWVAQVLFYGYVGTRFLHLWAYATAQIHDLRATFWTLGVGIVMGMAGWVGLVALGQV